MFLFLLKVHCSRSIRSQDTYCALKFKFNWIHNGSRLWLKVATLLLVTRAQTTKTCLENQSMCVILWCTYMQLHKGLWIIAMPPVTIIKVFLPVKLSILKSMINWRLISNCKRFIAIKIFNILPSLTNWQPKMLLHLHNQEIDFY